MKRRMIVPATTFVAMLAGSVTAAGDNQARDWAAGCQSCHYAGGTPLPKLHGQPRDQLVAKLRAFRDGTQPGTVMPQLAKGYTDAQIEAIADWFSRAKVSQ